MYHFGNTLENDYYYYNNFACFSRCEWFLNWARKEIGNNNNQMLWEWLIDFDFSVQKKKNSRRREEREKKLKLMWNQSESNLIRNQIVVTSGGYTRTPNISSHVQPIRKFWFDLHKRLFACVGWCFRNWHFVYSNLSTELFRFGKYERVACSNFDPIRFSPDEEWESKRRKTKFLITVFFGKTFSTHHHIKLYYYYYLLSSSSPSFEHAPQ